ncbi:hypothetical protein ACFQX7_34295, partial [Luedemannella flava]
ASCARGRGTGAALNIARAATAASIGPGEVRMSPISCATGPGAPVPTSPSDYYVDDTKISFYNATAGPVHVFHLWYDASAGRYRAFEAEIVHAGGRVVIVVGSQRYWLVRDAAGGCLAYFATVPSSTVPPSSPRDLVTSGLAHAEAARGCAAWPLRARIQPMASTAQDPGPDPLQALAAFAQLGTEPAHTDVDRVMRSSSSTTGGMCRQPWPPGCGRAPRTVASTCAATRAPGASCTSSPTARPSCGPSGPPTAATPGACRAPGCSRPWARRTPPCGSAVVAARAPVVGLRRGVRRGAQLGGRGAHRADADRPRAQRPAARAGAAGLPGLPGAALPCHRRAALVDLPGLGGPAVLAFIAPDRASAFLDRLGPARADAHLVTADGASAFAQVRDTAATAFVLNPGSPQPFTLARSDIEAVAAAPTDAAPPRPAAPDDIVADRPAWATRATGEVTRVG